MDLILPQLDFTVSVNACHDQIMHKMEVLTNMEIQLLRKFQHQVNNSDMHYKMIHDVRVLIVNIEEIYKDVREYFEEMGIKFIYDFFRKIQVLMVCGYNFLSQALLVNVDKIENKRVKEAQKASTNDSKTCNCACKTEGPKTKKRQIKDVEQFDYKISMLQNEQQKIASEIQSIYDKIMIQKPMVERTKPSLAIRELEDMKEHIENVMESTNSIFEETYMMKYVEFKNYLTQIKKPEDIVDYFVSNMNFSMKEKFLKAMQKAVYRAQHMDERIQRFHMKDVEVQTDKVKQQLADREIGFRGFSTRFEKNGTLLTKQRKYNQKMVGELQYMTKQINSLIAENQDLKKELQKTSEEHLKYKHNYETLEQLYGQRSYQLQVTQQQKSIISNEKEVETRKLRLEINQLRKDKVQMVDQQTQMFIIPNYTTTATATEIVFFQNQVDNEIINVLKKSNQKMILNLNEKQRKLRELVSIRQEYVFLKDCKVMCLEFLEDLRDVTTYKTNEVNKNEQKNSDKKKVRQPIIPLNINTSNNSIMITINKLTDEIKTLLLDYDFTKKRPNDKKKTMNYDSRQSSRNSSKMSQTSQQQLQTHFKSSLKKKNSIKSLKSQGAFLRSEKKSSYIEQFLINQQKRTKAQIMAITHLKNQVIDEPIISEKSLSESIDSDDDGSINSKNSLEHLNKQVTDKPITSKKSLNLGVQTPLKNSFPQKNDIKTPNRKSSFQQKMNTKKTNDYEPHPIKKIAASKQKFVQTQIIESKKSTPRIEKIQSVFTEAQIQTQISLEDLTEFETEFLHRGQQISKLKAEIESLNNNENHPQFTTRKNPYVRKPIGKFTKDKEKYPGTQSKNSLTTSHQQQINNTDVTQISQQIAEKQQEDDQPVLTPIGNSSSTDNIHKLPKMTLQSRLQQLIHPKNSQTSSASNLVVLKKSSQQYRKRVAHLPFDNLKIDKHLKQKQHQFRRTSREETLLISTQNENKWKEILYKFQQSIQNEKGKMKSKLKNQPFAKSNFFDNILEADSTNHSTYSNTSTLIEVSRKTPLQREIRLSPSKFELVDVVFARSVRQMLLSNESKQKIFRRIDEVYKEMQKEKQTKRIKRITKNSFTGRELRSQNSSKQPTKILKLGQVQY